ncbi:hypothetical protein TrST_g5424 [Triparma strigata]|uniref:Adhesin domain-containing protein n=1 Tax=Triparma strigata TaxID=1606541 RepID=A0A9W7E7R8_9STRA|nr:hypothetical protein TrST_g5424 [Triparma strigata]
MAFRISRVATTRACTRALSSLRRGWKITPASKLRGKWKSLSLPPLSRLSISVDPASFPNPHNTKVLLTLNPTWRDDGQIEFEQSLSSTCVELDVTVTKTSDGTADANTNGSSNGSVEIRIAPANPNPVSHIKTSQATPHDEFPNQFSPPTGFGNKQDDEQWPSLPYSADSEKSPSTDISSSLPSSSSSPTTLITLSLPQKLHLDAHLPIGDVNITDKIEGDTSIATERGGISVAKLRGHNITLSADGPIYSSKLIEAETAVINSDTRLRAKLINGKNIEINVDPSRKSTPPSLSHQKTSDKDDSGSLVDIGSLYTNDNSVPASITVFRPPSYVSPVSNVKVKGNHGNLHVKTNAVNLKNAKDTYGNTVPTVELGGVNGACEVYITGSVNSDILTARVHFDSVFKDSWSVVESEGGDIDITVDRKLHAEVKLMSFLDKFGEDQSSMLSGWTELPGGEAKEGGGDGDHFRIKKLTDATENVKTSMNEEYDLFQCEVLNVTEEPDSRFEAKTGNMKRGAGKVDIEGAKEFALKGFGGGGEEEDGEGLGGEGGEDAELPMISVGTGRSGAITLETLSWMDSIQRRFGMRGDSDQ